MQTQNSTLSPEDAKAFLRSTHVPDVMLALFRSVKCTREARLEDIPASERAFFQQIAETAVMLVNDPTLRDVGEYFAAHQVAQSREINFYQQPLINRWRIVQDAQLVIRRWLMFCSGEWPGEVASCRQRFEADKAAMEAIRKERVEFSRAQRRRFGLIDGGVQ